MKPGKSTRHFMTPALLHAAANEADKKGDALRAHELRRTADAISSGRMKQPGPNQRKIRKARRVAFASGVRRSIAFAR